MYTIACKCGFQNAVTPSMCGSTIRCTRCSESIAVPSLSQLKRSAGERFTMESDSEQVRRAVKEMRKPFDGTCQMCAQNVATELLPARITFLEQRVLTGSEIELSASHVKIGYAPSEETWQSVGIPCFFCQGCAETFRKGWRQSRMKALSMKFIRMIWIVPLAILAIVFIAMLPFVGWTLGAFIVYAIYRNLSRKRAAPYLSSHIRKLDVVAKLLEEVEFVLVHGPFRRL